MVRFSFIRTFLSPSFSHTAPCLQSPYTHTHTTQTTQPHAQHPHAHTPPYAHITLTPTDCWANVDRNASGYLLGETDHFPNGMKPVVDYVHSLNLTFGLYTCAGTKTCVGGRPGSKDHWKQDADLFAEWGVDWVSASRTRGAGDDRADT